MGRGKKMKQREMGRNGERRGLAKRIFQ